MKPERDPELTVSDRTDLDDARLIKIIHRPVLALISRRHQENKANRESEHIVQPHEHEKLQNLYL